MGALILFPVFTLALVVTYLALRWFIDAEDEW